MRVINHMFRKKVRRDDDKPVFDPGKAMEEDLKGCSTADSENFEDFIEDRVKDTAYTDISEFIHGR